MVLCVASVSSSLQRLSSFFLNAFARDSRMPSIYSRKSSSMVCSFLLAMPFSVFCLLVLAKNRHSVRESLLRLIREKRDNIFRRIFLYLNNRCNEIVYGIHREHYLYQDGSAIENMKLFKIS